MDIGDKDPDEDFCPNDNDDEDEEGKDDEATLEEQEKLENQADIAEELDALNEEQEMPIEDLMKLYGYGKPSLQNSDSTNDGENEQEESPCGTQDTSHNRENSSSTITDEFRGDHNSNLDNLKFYLASGSEDFEDEDEDGENDVDYEPVQLNDDLWRKTIRIGPEYQADVPDTESLQIPIIITRNSNSSNNDGSNEDQNNDQKELLCWNQGLVWNGHKISESDVEDFLSKFYLSFGEHEAQKFKTPISLVDNESALLALLECNFDFESTLQKISGQQKAILTADERILILWTENEIVAFEEALKTNGKNFNLIQKLIPTKCVKDVVEFYYLWKLSPMYTEFTRRLEDEYTKYLQLMIVKRQEAAKLSDLLSATTPLDANSRFSPLRKENDTNDASQPSPPAASVPSAGAELPAELQKQLLMADAVQMRIAPPPFAYRIVNRQGRLKIRWLSRLPPPPHGGIEEADTHRAGATVAPSSDVANWSRNVSDTQANSIVNGTH